MKEYYKNPAEFAFPRRLESQRAIFFCSARREWAYLMYLAGHEGEYLCMSKSLAHELHSKKALYLACTS